MRKFKTMKTLILISMSLMTALYLNNAISSNNSHIKTVIISGGTPPSKKLLDQEITKKTIVIAADSGANCLWKYKITPDYLLGDFDSIDHKILKEWENKNIVIERHPSEKNLTDTELALEKAIALKSKEIVILGALGGKRVDHLLGGIGLLNQALKVEVTTYLKDDYQTIALINKPTKLTGKPGQNFSLQAYGGNVKGLTIKDAKYPLKNYTLKMGEGLTLSNEFKSKKVTVNFTSGKLLVFTFIQGI